MLWRPIILSFAAALPLLAFAPDARSSSLGCLENDVDIAVVGTVESVTVSDKGHQITYGIAVTRTLYGKPPEKISLETYRPRGGEMTFNDYRIDLTEGQTIGLELEKETSRGDGTYSLTDIGCGHVFVDGELDMMLKEDYDQRLSELRRQADANAISLTEPKTSESPGAYVAAAAILTGLLIAVIAAKKLRRGTP